MGDSLPPVTGLVLARGGSVGIPGKNLRELAGSTLIQRCVAIITRADCFTSIWVSTDDATIGALARDAGAQVHWRSAASATSDASSVAAIQDFLAHHPECGRGLLCLVQCTSPFLQPRYLHQALKLVRTGQVDSVFSAVRSHQLRWTEKDGVVSPLNFSLTNRPSRHCWPGELCETGMFYLARAAAVRDQGLVQHGRVGVVEVDPADSVDIDSPFDLALAECLLAAREKTESEEGGKHAASDPLSID